MASNGTPQSELYGTGYGNLSNTYRDRSAEQNFTNSGNPMSYIPNYFDPMYGTQQPGLSRYSPPMLSNPWSGANNWMGGMGGYAYNLPTSFGPYGGSWGSPYSQQGPQSQQGIQQAGQMGYGNGYPGGGYPQQQMNYNGFPPTTYNNGYPQGGFPQGQMSGGAPIPQMPGAGVMTPGQNSNQFNRLGGALSGGYGMPQVNMQPPGGNNQTMTYGGAPVPAMSWQGHNVTSDQMSGIQAAMAARNAWWANHNAQPVPTPLPATS